MQDKFDVLAKKIADPEVTRLEIEDFPTIYQIGFCTVYVDPIGRFWRVTTSELARRIVAEMFWDPHGPSRGREAFDIQDHMGVKFPHEAQGRDQ